MADLLGLRDLAFELRVGLRDPVTHELKSPNEVDKMEA